MNTLLITGRKSQQKFNQTAPGVIGEDGGFWLLAAWAACNASTLLNLKTSICWHIYTCGTSPKEPAGNGSLWLRRQSCTTSQDSAAKAESPIPTSGLPASSASQATFAAETQQLNASSRDGRGSLQNHQAAEAAKSLCRIWWGYGPGPEAFTEFHGMGGVFF